MRDRSVRSDMDLSQLQKLVADSERELEALEAERDRVRETLREAVFALRSKLDNYIIEHLDEAGH